TEEAAEAFASGLPREISRALLRLALHGPDWRLAEERALEHVSHPDAWVRRNAATSLGHIARVSGRLDARAAVPALLLMTADPEVADYADAALDDLEHYLGIDRQDFIGRKRAVSGPHR
ncbi:MAG TPA: hypothetical protein VFX98_10825, partial [Longimicrobiaceae bacterium]|nr:hypothetical protein [Longimicrobiaceae bacterium]